MIKDLKVKGEERAEQIARDRYKQLLGSIVSVKTIDYAYNNEGDEPDDNIEVECEVRIIETDESDVVRYMSNEFIDPLYNVEVIDQEKYPQLKGLTAFAIFGESIEIID